MDWVGEMSFDEMMKLAAEGNTDSLQKTLAGRMAKYFDPKIEYWNVPLIRSEKHNEAFTDNVLERPVDQRTLTQRYTDEAVRFVAQNKDQPFLLYLAYTMPHTPLFRSDDFADRSLGGRYGDVIEELDWSVGEIIDKLEQLGLDENTLVIFSSDNGPWLLMQQHGGTAGLLRGGKGTTFEGGMRVPAIFWWPGTIKPAVRSDIGSTLDVYATALSLAGAQSTSDGHDLSDTLKNATAGPRETLTYYRSGELYAIRKGPYKLHLITEGAYQAPPVKTVHERPLLYHLGSDPGEQFDLSAQMPDVVKELMHAVETHRNSISEKPPLFDLRLQSLTQSGEE
jgi:arylsulfatase A-like enzyme